MVDNPVAQPTGTTVQTPEGTIQYLLPANRVPADVVAAERVASGEPHAWTSIATTTVLRSVLIAPALWLVGVRGWKIGAGAVGASATISVAQVVRAKVLAKHDSYAEMPGGSGVPVIDLNSPSGNPAGDPRC